MLVNFVCVSCVCALSEHILTLQQFHRFCRCVQDCKVHSSLLAKRFTDSFPRLPPTTFSLNSINILMLSSRSCSHSVVINSNSSFQRGRVSTLEEWAEWGQDDLMSLYLPTILTCQGTSTNPFLKVPNAANILWGWETFWTYINVFWAFLFLPNLS